MVINQIQSNIKVIHFDLIFDSYHTYPDSYYHKPFQTILLLAKRFEGSLHLYSASTLYYIEPLHNLGWPVFDSTHVPLCNPNALRHPCSTSHPVDVELQHHLC